MALVITLLFIRTGIAMSETKVTFDETKALPKGWNRHHRQRRGKWKLPPMTLHPRAQCPEAIGEATFCWAAKTDEHIQDGFAEVKFKSVSARKIRPAASSSASRTQIIIMSCEECA